MLASLSPKELAKIRNGVSCPECGAEPGARCHDENGWTMAFLHDAAHRRGARRLSYAAAYAARRRATAHRGHVVASASNSKTRSGGAAERAVTS